jgi:predicted ABC-type ATPase
MTVPVLTVIAGADGSGKSTLTKWARNFFQQASTLDPDAFAEDLQVQTGQHVNPITAGRQVLKATRDFLSKGVSFSIETTLAGNTYLEMIAAAKRAGYRTRLFYIGTESLDITMARVRARVLAGGHDVAIEDQIRRYPRSFANLPKALQLVHEAILFDNSSDEIYRVIALKLMEGRFVLAESLPHWAEFLRKNDNLT